METALETTTEVKRRLPRKRVRIVKVVVIGEDGTTVEVDGKECTKCGEVKALTEYHKHTRSPSGYRAECMACVRQYSSDRYVIRREHIREINAKWSASNPEKVEERTRKHRQANPEKYRERRRKWDVDNPENNRAKTRRYRAMKRALPSRWTASDEAKMCECALMQSTAKVHVDHVIPLAWGHGGSYVGNMIPLSSTLNESKNDAHVYEWFSLNAERFSLDRSRFVAMIAVVAEQNGLTSEEYRAYYDWCYANKRSVAQTKRDNSKYGRKIPSIELWREASGLPIPIRIDFGKETPIKRRVQTRSSRRVDTKGVASK